jgi:hypothetical protein
LAFAAIEFCPDQIAEFGAFAHFLRHVDAQGENRAKTSGRAMLPQPVANSASRQVVVYHAIPTAAMRQHVVGRPVLAKQTAANVAAAPGLGANDLSLRWRKRSAYASFHHGTFRQGLPLLTRVYRDPPSP